MQLPHDKFCVLPWISLEASPIGTVRPCCLADDEIVDNAGNKFELSTANFKAIQNSNHMRDLRQEFLDEKKPQTCRKCWNEERSGRTSKRMHTLNKLKHTFDEQTWTTDAKDLIYLDLKLGNICNLKCRICGSWSSSQFATEELNQLLPTEKKSSFHYQMLRAGAWPQENANFWDQIDSCLTDIRYIEFTGGEPFMIDQHFDMLQGIVDRGIAHQVEIHYNTNGTQYPERGVDIWCHFKRVEVAFSIDDTGPRFEYQRTNAKWAEVEDNVQKFAELKKIVPCLTLQVCCTVNIFNILNLHETSDWIYREGFDFVYWNMMHEAWYFSIANLPKAAKEKIDAIFANRPTHPECQAEFIRVIDFMNRGADSDGSMMRMKIRDLDRKRQQNLAEVDPSLAAILEYDYNQA